jgi:hypothetical protein
MTVMIVVETKISIAAEGPVVTYTCTISLATLRSGQDVERDLDEIVVTGCLIKKTLRSKLLFQSLTW